MKARGVLKDPPSSIHSVDVIASAAQRTPTPMGTRGTIPRKETGLKGDGSPQRDEDKTASSFTASSFDEIYERWFHDVCRWARGMGGLHADVEDIAQDVFLVVRRKLGDFDGAHPKAWLYRITQRTVSDYRRAAWFRRVLRPAADFLDQIIDPADGPRDVVQTRQAEKRVADILERMSMVRRTAFILYEIEGYSGEEIAELEGVPLKTVYTRLHHARKDFFRAMNGLKEEDFG